MDTVGVRAGVARNMAPCFLPAASYSARLPFLSVSTIDYHCPPLVASSVRLFQFCRIATFSSLCSCWRDQERGAMFLACSFLLCSSPMSLGDYNRLSLPTSTWFICSIISAFSHCNFELSLLRFEDGRFKKKLHDLHALFGLINSVHLFSCSCIAEVFIFWRKWLLYSKSQTLYLCVASTTKNGRCCSAWYNCYFDLWPVCNLDPCG
jgi:hypothetical protein